MNASHFVDMKKNGSLYQASDGSKSNMFENVTQGEGDCVVYKNGKLLASPCDQSAYFVCENEYVAI
jgi:Lectin C-type domain